MVANQAFKSINIEVTSLIISYSLASCSRCYKHIRPKGELISTDQFLQMVLKTDKLLMSDLVDVVNDIMIVGGVISVSGMQVWL